MLQFGYKRTIHAIPLYVNPFFSSPNVNFLFLFLVFFRFFHDILWPLSRPPHSVRGLPCAPRFPASNFWRNHNILSYFSASPCQIGDPNRSSSVFPQKMLRFSKGRCIILRQHEHLPFGERFPLICGDPPFEPPLRRLIWFCIFKMRSGRKARKTETCRHDRPRRPRYGRPAGLMPRRDPRYLNAWRK